MRAQHLLQVVLLTTVLASCSDESPPAPQKEKDRAAAACHSAFDDVRLSNDSTAGQLRFFGPRPTPGPGSPLGNFPALQDNEYVALCLVGSETSDAFVAYGVPMAENPLRLWTQSDSDGFRPPP